MIRQNKSAIILWTLFTLFLMGQFIFHDYRSVSSVYYYGALAYMHGQPLYANSGRGFIYLPTSVFLYIPFAQFPYITSEILWRLFNVVLFILASYRFAVICPSFKRNQLFLLMTIMVILLGGSAFRNGQMHIILISCMLLVAVFLQEQKWWWAAFWLALSFALKPTSIYFLIIVCLLFWPVAWRTFLILVTLIAATFALHNPHYIIDQYIEFYQTYELAITIGQQTPLDWASIYSLLMAMHIPLPSAAQSLISSLIGIALLCLCYYRQKRMEFGLFLYWLYSVTSCYLLAFNPRTEQNGYVFLAVAFAISLAEAMRFRQTGKIALLWFFILSIAILSLFYKPLSPLIVFCYFISLLFAYQEKTNELFFCPA